MSTAAQRDGRAPIAVVRTLRFAGSGFAAAGLCAAYPSEHRGGCSPYGERTNQIGASAFHLLLVHILQIRIPVQPLFVRLQQPPRFLVPQPPFPQRGFHVPPQTAHQRVEENCTESSTSPCRSMSGRSASAAMARPLSVTMDRGRLA